MSETLITTAEALAETVGLLASVDRVAIDTEADSLHSYFEKLCLIQISIPDRNFLVDPLAGVPLQPLFESLGSKELVIHGADFDLRLLRRAGQQTVGRVFDTMIAARLTGRMDFSYSALVTELFGVVLTKSSQKANWGLRPLPQKMADYAVNDTLYLLKIAEILEAELKELGRLGWLRESCEKVAQFSAFTRERDLDNAWRVSGSADLSRQGAAVLRALWHWREEEAKRIDRPAFHILRSEELVESAARLTGGGTVAYRHLAGGRRKRFLLAADAALALPETEWPIRPPRVRLRPTSEEEERFRELKARRDKAAAELHLDPSLIAPKAALEAVARNQADVMLLSWQWDLLQPPPDAPIDTAERN